MLSSTDLEVSKREGRSHSQDKRRGRSRSPSAYLRKKGRRLSDLLSSTTLKTLVPKRTEEFLGNISMSSPKRTASVSSFTSLTSQDVHEGTLNKSIPNKDESNECPPLVDIAHDKSSDKDRPTEVPTEDESCILQPSDAIPADETPAALIATVENHSEVITSVPLPLDDTDVTPGGLSPLSDAHVNEAKDEDPLASTKETKTPQIQRMKSVGKVNVDVTRNPSADEQLIHVTKTHAYAESQANDEKEQVAEVVESVSTAPSVKSVNEICLGGGSAISEAQADCIMQTHSCYPKIAHRLVLKLLLMFAVISVVIAPWMALKYYASSSEVFKSEMSYGNVVPHLMEINPKPGTKVSLSSLHSFFFNAKRLVREVSFSKVKAIHNVIGMKHLLETKKSAPVDETLELGEKLRIRTLISVVPHMIDSFKLGIVGK